MAALSMARQNLHPGMPGPYAIYASQHKRKDEKMLLLRLRAEAVSQLSGHRSAFDVPSSFPQLLALVTSTSKTALSSLLLLDASTSHKGSLADCVQSPDHVFTLLKVFREYEPVHRAQVMVVMRALWGTSAFLHVLAETLERSSDDITSVTDLFSLAYMLSFQVPDLPDYAADIFPYGRAYAHSITSKYGARTESFIRSVCCSYYIRIIHNILSMNKVQPINKLKQVLARYNAFHQKKVLSAISTGELHSFLDDVVWNLISSTNSHFCAIGVFLLLQFLVSKNAKLKAFVGTYSPIEGLQRACRSSSRHVKWACAHVQGVLLSEQWIGFLCRKYGIQWVKDIADESISDSMSSFAFDFATYILHNNEDDDQRLHLVLNNHVYRSLMKSITSQVHSKRLLAISQVLVEIFRCASKSHKHLMLLLQSPPQSYEVQGEVDDDVKSSPLSIVNQLKSKKTSSPSLNSTNTKSRKTGSFRKRKFSLRKSRSSSEVAQQQQHVTAESAVSNAIAATSSAASAYDPDDPDRVQLLQLPLKLIAHVLSFVDAEDMFTCASLCKLMNIVVDESQYSLWKGMYMKLSNITSSNSSTSSANASPSSSPLRPRKSRSSTLLTGSSKHKRTRWKRMVKDKLRVRLIHMLYNMWHLIGDVQSTTSPASTSTSTSRARSIPRSMHSSTSALYDNADDHDEAPQSSTSSTLSTSMVMSPIVVSSSSVSPNALPHLCETTTARIRINMLTSLRMCIKTRTFYDLFVKSNFFVHMWIPLLRDGSSVELNRHAWRLLYQLLAYHSGTAALLERNGSLLSALQLINATSSDATIVNGLYYLNKILSDPPKKRDDSARVTRKDIKVVVRVIMENNLWSHFYTIYLAIEHFHESTREDRSSRSFVFPSIAHLFATVVDSYVCQKLRKSIFKIDMYKDSCTKLRNLFRIQIPTQKDLKESKDMKIPESPSLSRSKSSD